LIYKLIDCKKGYISKECKNEIISHFNDIHKIIDCENTKFMPNNSSIYNKNTVNSVINIEANEDIFDVTNSSSQQIINICDNSQTNKSQKNKKSQNNNKNIDNKQTVNKFVEFQELSTDSKLELMFQEIMELKNQNNKNPKIFKNKNNYNSYYNRNNNFQNSRTNNNSNKIRNKHNFNNRIFWNNNRQQNYYRNNNHYKNNEKIIFNNQRQPHVYNNRNSYHNDYENYNQNSWHDSSEYQINSVPINP
jgi:hypothetical protein